MKRARTDAAPAATRDPTLYRVLAFPSANSLDSSESAEKRLQTLESFLREMRWIPEDNRLRPPSDLEPKTGTFWDEEWRERQEGWSTHRFAREAHEILTIMLGVSRDGLQPKAHQWTIEARQLWEAYFTPDTKWKRAVTLPEAKSSSEHQELLGELWIWTGECEEDVKDWSLFGSARFPGGCIAFPWGVLGRFHPDEQVHTVCFELFTSVDQREQRDLFLFEELSIVFGEYLKATQRIRGQYFSIVQPQLNDLERNILLAARKISQRETGDTLDVAEKNVRCLNELLLRMSWELWNVQYDAKSAEMAREPIENIFSRNGGVFVGALHNPLIIGEVDRIARQLDADLIYFRATEQSARRSLDAQQTLIEIENARGQDRLAAVGIIVGSFIALGHVLDSIELEIPFTYMGVVHKVKLGFILAMISVVVGCVGAFFVWLRFRR